MGYLTLDEVMKTLGLPSTKEKIEKYLKDGKPYWWNFDCSDVFTLDLKLEKPQWKEGKLVVEVSDEFVDLLGKNTEP